MASIGIDLGTTTTLLAEAISGFDTDDVEAKIVPTQQRVWRGKQITEEQFGYLPSFAYFPTSGEEIVGVEAKILGTDRNELDRCVRAVKRLMGRSIVLPEPIGRTPSQISALYLQHLLHHARRTALFSEHDELTITVPASFTTNQRRDTLQALEIAASNINLQFPKTNLSRVLISEPVAALLAYLALDLRKAEQLRHFNLDRNSLVLVYDMGGGTLDLTLVQLGWQHTSSTKTLGNVRFEIRELNRYNQFAGEDFDTLVAQSLLERLIAEYPDLELLDLTDAEARSVRFRLIEDAERLKKELNSEIAWSDDKAAILFSLSPILLRGREYHLTDWEITYNDYSRWVEPYLSYRQDQKNALYPIEDLLSRSGLQIKDVDYFLLVGGMARFIPLQNALKKYWQRDETFLIHPSPDEAVAQGAAVYSHLKAQRKDFTIDEPSADAYYVRRSNGFGLLLGRGSHTTGEKREFKLQSEGERLRLQIFAGEPPPTTEKIENIYPSLVYQGGALIPLKKVYPRGTKVWIQMRYRMDDNSKVPQIDIWVDKEDNLVASLSYAELQD
ncbi:Hsp70 family protein [Aggregatilineales bacterium SYSU G02658]